MRTRALPLVIALSLATAPLTYHLPYAIAQGMDADTKEAKTLFEDGVKLFKAGKFEEARVKFKAAYGLKKRPSIVLNLAHAEKETKRYLDAIVHFKELMAMADAKPEDKDDAKQGLADARKQVSTIVIDAPTGTYVIIDGETKSLPADNMIEVLPGTHTVAVKLGGKDVVKKLDLTAGQTVEIKGGSEPQPVATTPPVATTAPPATTETAPPVATVEPAPTTTATTAPTTPEQPPSDQPKQSFFKTIHPVTYVAAGATVVFAVGWIAFFAKSQTHYDNADEYAAALKRPTCGTPASVGQACTSASNEVKYRTLGKEELDSGDSARSLAIVSGVLTGVAAGVTIATFILLRKKDKPAVSFVTAPTYGGMQFSISGSF